MKESGMRVGVICSITDTEVQLFGFGTYVGDEVPPEDIGGFNIGLPNPKIQLDSGDIIWGCECWWGEEEDLKEKLKNTTKTIVDVDIKDLRKKYKEQDYGRI